MKRKVTNDDNSEITDIFTTQIKAIAHRRKKYIKSQLKQKAQTKTEIK